MIISRTGETLLVSSSGRKVTVVLTEDTRTKDNKGLLGLRKEYMSNTVLIPGLKVKVEGVSDNEGRVVAKTISVDGDDLETAEMIQAGLNPTAEQVGANMQAIEGNKQNIATNQQSIAANQQNIAANKQGHSGKHRSFLQVGRIRREGRTKREVQSWWLSNLARGPETASTVGKKRDRTNWIHHRGEGLRRLERQRADE